MTLSQDTLGSGRHLFLAFSSPIGDPSEFGSWYDGEHIPAILGAEGMRGAQRFAIAATKTPPGAKHFDGGTPKPPPGVESFSEGHLALYEIEGDARPFREEVKRQLMTGEMVIPEFMNPPFTTLILKPVSEPSEGVEYDANSDLRDRHLFFAFSRHTGDYEPFAGYYDDVHIPQILSLPGVFRVQRFMQSEVKPLPGVVTPDVYHLVLCELVGDPLPFREGLKSMMMSGEMVIPSFIVPPIETSFMRPVSPFFPVVAATA